MDAIPRGSLMNYQNNIENEISENKNDEEFDFNQDHNVEFEEYRSPGWDRLKKN